MPSIPSVGLSAYLGALCFLATVIVPVGLISWRLERRTRFALRAALFVIVIIAEVSAFNAGIQAILSVSPLNRNTKYIYLVYYFVTFIFVGAGVAVCYKCNIWHALFCVTVGYCLQHISARINAIMTEIIFSPVHWAVSSVTSLVIAAVVYVAFYFAVMRRSKIDYASVLAGKFQIFISACVVGVLIFYNSMGISYISALIFMAEDGNAASDVGNLALLFVYVMSMLVALLALTLDLSVCYGSQVKNERDALERILDDSKRRFEQEKRNIDMINIKCHDLKHQLAAMKGKIYEEQIEELSNAIGFYDADIKTGNEALDLVLTQKNFYCTQNGIRLTCLLNGEHYDFIARHELYALFNNAIDNAIEAVEKIPEDKRVISVTEKVSGSLVSVRVENYFDGEIKFADDLPLTDKTGEGHGLGVKSIKMIAEKYGGGISASVDGDMFILDIFLNDIGNKK